MQVSDNRILKSCVQLRLPRATENIQTQRRGRSCGLREGVDSVSHVTFLGPQLRITTVALLLSLDKDLRGTWFPPGKLKIKLNNKSQQCTSKSVWDWKGANRQQRCEFAKYIYTYISAIFEFMRLFSPLPSCLSTVFMYHAEVKRKKKMPHDASRLDHKSIVSFMTRKGGFVVWADLKWFSDIQDRKNNELWKMPHI